MNITRKHTVLNLLKPHEYIGVNDDDPIGLYYWPVIGRMYRHRVEMCLDELTGGGRILEVGFGTGITFFQLNEKYHEIHGLDLTAETEKIQQAFAERGITTNLQKGNVLAMPYPDDYFDSVLLISILEHLHPEDQDQAFKEIRRVLKPGGQVVYGVPVERPLMIMMFRVLGYNIHQHHFSTEQDVEKTAARYLAQVRKNTMTWLFGLGGAVYIVGHLIKK
jgi:ubiquinone/menaquinone biosynthesis C-methylase UbiE